MSRGSVDTPPEERSRGLAVRIAAVVAIVAIAGAATILLWPSSTAGQTHEILVPAGTQDLIDDGERVELLPRTFEVAIGDRIVIINDDDATHQVGPYIVGPGQRIEQQFLVPGRIEGVCTLHPSGEVAIVVR